MWVVVNVLEFLELLPGSLDILYKNLKIMIFNFR